MKTDEDFYFYQMQEAFQQSFRDKCMVFLASSESQIPEIATDTSKSTKLTTRPKLKLFLDLDGVLADFERGVFELTHRHAYEFKKEDLWKKITKCPNFFETLNWAEQGEELWSFIKEHQQDLSVSILTGIPTGKSGKEVKKQKMMWCASHLSDQIPVLVCQTADKHIYSGQNHVLIDDNPELAEEWEEKGGTFIRHTSTQATKQQLSSLLFQGTEQFIAEVQLLTCNRSEEQEYNLLQPVVLVSASENAYDKTYLKI